MTENTTILSTDELRSLIERRRAGTFVDFDDGEAETRAMLERKKNLAFRHRSACPKPP